MEAWWQCEIPYPFVPRQVLDAAESVRGSLPNRYCDPRIAADLFEEVIDEFLLCDDMGMNVLAIERTLLEKATILHSVCHRPEAKPPRERFSRHYYDVHHLAQDANMIARAIADTELLAAIVENKRAYFYETWNWYPSAKRGSFRLVPSVEKLEYLTRDYQAMRHMIFGDTPDFSEIIDTLKKLEDQFNVV